MSENKNNKEETALQVNKDSLVESLFSLLDESGQVISLDEQGQIRSGASEEMIPLKTWAVQHGITPATARQKAGRGMLRTARKVGRDWMISKYEPNIDHRSKDRLPALEGPIHIDEVLHYLLLLNASNTMPEKWEADHIHQKYCRGIFIQLRSRMTGDPQILFDLLCDAMSEQEGPTVYYIPHEEILSNIEDEAFRGRDYDTIDFKDYTTVLSNILGDLMGHVIELHTHRDTQTILLPWYKSITWKKDKNDGLYFIPSDFFRLIFMGLN